MTSAMLMRIIHHCTGLFGTNIHVMTSSRFTCLLAQLVKQQVYEAHDKKKSNFLIEVALSKKQTH